MVFQDTKIFYVIIAKFFHAFLGFLIFFLISNKLSIESFGVYQSFFTIMNWGTLLLSFGLNSKIFETFSRNNKDSLEGYKLAAHSGIFSFIACFFIFIFLMCFFNFNDLDLIGLFICTFLNIMTINMNSIDRGNLNFSRQLFFSGIFLNILLIGFVLLSESLTHNKLILYLELSLFLNIIILFVIHKDIIKPLKNGFITTVFKFKKMNYSKIFNQGNVFYFNDLLSSFVILIPIFLLTYLGMFKDLALLSFSLKVLFVFNLIYQSLCLYQIPIFIRNYKKKQIAAWRNLFFNSFCVFILLIAFALAFFSYIEEVIVFINADYLSSSLIIKIMIFSCLINALTGPSESLLIYTRYAKKLNLYRLFLIPFYCLAFYYSYKIYGIVSIAIVILFITIFMNIVYLSLMLKLYESGYVFD